VRLTVPVQRQAARTELQPRRLSAATGCSAALFSAKKLIDRKPDIFRDLSQECWCDISTGVTRDRGPTPVGMSVLLVGTTLPNFFETLLFEKRCHLFWLQNRDIGHLTYPDRLNANELRLQGRFTVLE